MRARPDRKYLINETSRIRLGEPFMRTWLSSVLACCATMMSLLVLSSVGLGQDKAVLDPQKADADFAYQGEYLGEIERDGAKVTLGVQMIAQGKGKFLGVGYFGGLPGEGGIGNDLMRAEGDIKEGGIVAFTNEADVRIENGVLTIRNNDGGLIGECKKVIRKSSTLGAEPPAGAVVLFDGKLADKFDGGKLDGDLLVQGVTSKQKFQNFTVHLEFMLSYMPTERGQGRGNSGFYAQGRYEVQILDSFGLKGENNECGGIYEVKKPDVNMCFPPLSWQTYDVDFTAAKYDNSGKKTADARMTVKHNGVLIHDNVAVPKATRAAPVAEGADPGPIYLQDHGNPIRFRNIWVVEK